MSLPMLLSGLSQIKNTVSAIKIGSFAEGIQEISLAMKAQSGDQVRLNKLKEQEVALNQIILTQEQNLKNGNLAKDSRPYIEKMITKEKEKQVLLNQQIKNIEKSAVASKTNGLLSILTSGPVLAAVTAGVLGLGAA